MHISDGVLSLEVTVVSTIVAFCFFAYSFRSLNNEKIVLASAFSALFFVASFIHIPFGPTQIHLMLLGFGGVSSIGVNVLIMGLASYLVYIIFKLNFFKALNEKVKFFLIGFSGVFISTFILFLHLIISKDEYEKLSYTIIFANIPTMILEGLVTLFLFLYIKKTMPSLLKGLNI